MRENNNQIRPGGLRQCLAAGIVSDLKGAACANGVRAVFWLMFGSS